MFSERNQQWAKSNAEVNPDLLNERATLNFNQQQLAEIIWDGKKGLQRHREISDLHNTDPILKNTHHYYDMTREEKIETAYAKTARLLSVLPEDMSYTNTIYLTMLNQGAVSTRQFHISIDCKQPSSWNV